MSTTKVASIGAFHLDSSKTPVAYETSHNTLGTGHAFPWLTLGIKKVVNHEEDTAISAFSFGDTPRLTGHYIEDSISTYLRYSGLEEFLYWCFGMEHAPVPVCIITTETFGTYYEGAVYEDESSNQLTILRVEHLRNGTDQIVLRCDDNVLANGDLTRTSGQGPNEVVVETISTILYEHLFELDAFERHQTTFRTSGTGRYNPDVGENSELAPINTLGNTLVGTDRKCRRAIIGKKLATGDFVFPGAMCKKFSISSEAGKLLTISADYVARDKEVSGTASTTWTTKTEFVTNDNVAGHHESSLWLTTTDSEAYPTLGMTSFDLSVECPLKIEQDSVSGLFIEEPVFEGVYKLSLNVQLSRHSVETFEGYRDNWDSVITRIEMHRGYEKIAILVENAKLDTPGPSDDEVAKQDLNLIIGKSDADVFVTSLYGYNNVNSSPVLLLLRNNVATQQMDRF